MKNFILFLALVLAPIVVCAQRSTVDEYKARFYLIQKEAPFSFQKNNEQISVGYSGELIFITVKNSFIFSYAIDGAVVAVNTEGKAIVIDYFVMQKVTSLFEGASIFLHTKKLQTAQTRTDKTSKNVRLYNVLTKLLADKDDIRLIDKANYYVNGQCYDGAGCIIYTKEVGTRVINIFWKKDDNSKTIETRAEVEGDGTINFINTSGDAVDKNHVSKFQRIFDILLRPR